MEDVYMSREEASTLYQSITSGEGIDRNRFIGRIGRGVSAVGFWNDGRFTLGIEYGYLMGLIDAFGLDRDDIGEAEDAT